MASPDTRVSEGALRLAPGVSRGRSRSLGRLGVALRGTAWFVVPLLLGALVWELVARFSDAASMPALGEIASAWWTLLQQGEIVSNVGRTLATAAVALGLAGVVGVAVGVAMGRSEIMAAALRPYVDMAMSAPLVVFVPVFSVLLTGEFQVIVATAFVYCVFPILENARLGTLGVSPDLVAMARSFGASRRRVVARVVIPAALPLILTGARIAVSKAFKGVLLGEILITVVGLGGRIRYYGSGFRTDYVYALTGTTIVLALILVAFMRALELSLRRRFPTGTSDTIMEG
jgi:NitT/TauT family transport system permease protein